jgi:hypothetical protein
MKSAALVIIALCAIVSTVTALFVANEVSQAIDRAFSLVSLALRFN